MIDAGWRVKPWLSSFKHHTTVKRTEKTLEDSRDIYIAAIEATYKCTLM